jgi:putative heme-binding domain-containing protein
MKTQNLIFGLIVPAFFACNAEKQETERRTKQEEQETAYKAEKPDSIYAEHVRSTSFQLPEDEKKDFILPPGFKITLFASEPDITKPINMAFDEKGRLWVTQSSEYPIKAGPGKGTDRISILEDTDKDGKADKITNFANDLNIPIGIQPVKGGAIGFSIPNLYRFYDTDGDDVADKREVILGPFETKDTHGMVNNLFRGLDGWIHASHGFSNVSTVAGKDGDSIQMTSGNTFRFTLDGERAEKTSDGRINPFGSDLDKWGYHYSADCHTLPIYQIIRNGNYTQWGKMEPNMGHAPTMMDYGLNSTALSGLVYYTDNQFPAEYQNSFYSGDVVTCRISRSTISFNGSTPKATRKADFLVSKDPWFRPVDIKIGPDGAMYIADFYNPIIGHYEVPLDHPERDRNSGRIWKITYKDQEREPVNWTKSNLAFLIEKLNDPILQTRMMATDELVDRFNNSATPSLKKLVAAESTPDIQKVQGLWALFRLDALPDNTLKNALSATDVLVRVHAQRILGEYQHMEEQQIKWIKEGLDDQSAHVRRVAAENLIRHQNPTMVSPIIKAIEDTDKADSHLLYALKYALYQHAQVPEIARELAAKEWSDTDKEVIALVFSDTRSETAAGYLLDYLQNNHPSKEKYLAYLTSITRELPASKMDEIIALAKKTGHELPDFKIVMALNDGIRQRGSDLPAPLKSWNQLLSAEILENASFGNSNRTEEQEAELKYAIGLSGLLKINKNITPLKVLVNNTQEQEELRILAANALIEIAPRSQVMILEKWLNDPESTIGFRQKIAEAIAKPGSDQSIHALAKGVKNIPMEIQKTIAAQLATSNEGKTRLVKLIKEGHAPARVLKDRRVEERFLSGADEKQKMTFNELTENLPPIDEEKQALIVLRTENYQSNPSQVGTGKLLFRQNCGMCHKIADDGGMIGPQLDGVGNWGLNALATKVLDPNRNISENFRTYTINLKNGQTKTGLFRREDGQVLVMADQSGEEFTVAKKDISQQVPSNMTLMPDHFGNVLDQSQFNNLMTYLLSLR